MVQPSWPIFTLRAQYGETALMAAAEEGHISVVEYLVWRGADPGPMNKACFAGYNVESVLPMTTVLMTSHGALRRQFQRTALMGAAEHGHLSIVECLVQAGADVNKANKVHGRMLPATRKLATLTLTFSCHKQNGWTPLMVAACRGHIAVVEYLRGQAGDEAEPDVVRFAFNLLTAL